ncbi:ArsR family transcriptional regulator [Bacillus sp. T33-2]|nr:ArsR family transcriptional regulator [Bacillus sp. T33-2]
MITSLHVLYNPAHHLPRLAWAEEMKAAMKPSLWESACLYGELSNEWLNFLDLQDHLNFEEKHPEEAIERIRQLNSEKFIDFFLGKRASLPHAELSSGEREVLSKPRYFQAELCEFLYQYQQQFFARELFRVEPWLVKSVHELKARMKNNPAEAVGSIHPRFKLERKSLKFFKAETWVFDYAEIDTLTIYPSTFIAPHLLVGLEVPHIIVYYQVALPKEHQPAGVPEDLMDILQAFGDKTRLNLLRMLLYHPYCTQQLTEKTGLAKATVSKHLKLLEGAGLLHYERHGHFVFYRTKKEKLEQLKVDLNQFFDQPLMEKKEES